MNPYALGFAMYTDLKRICEADRRRPRLVPRHRWRPWLPTLDQAMRNYKATRASSAVPQPAADARVAPVRHRDDAQKLELEVSVIHDGSGYRRVRESLSRQYDLGSREPNIQVWNVNLAATAA